MCWLCGRQASCWNAKQDGEGWLLLNGPRVANGHTRWPALCLSVSSSHRWLLTVVINVSHRHTLKQNTDKSVLSFRSFRCTNTLRQIGCLSLCHLYTQKNTSPCKHTQCSHTHLSGVWIFTCSVIHQTGTWLHWSSRLTEWSTRHTHTHTRTSLNVLTPFRLTINYSSYHNNDDANQNDDDDNHDKRWREW